MTRDADNIQIPRATYRLQFHKGFGFQDAATIAPYLARLGVSHVYASPYLKARPGSTHGYDIVDHNQLNPELGDESAFRDMVQAFADNGLGQVLDFVPNHMGVGGADNSLWFDVLEWGPASEYAGWFDIDWEPDGRYLQEKLLVPFLGDQYGAVLEAGELVLRFDAADGSFAIWAYDTHKLPICPLHYARVLGDEHAELERLGDAFSGLPDWRPRVAQRAKDLQSELGALARERDDVQRAVKSAVARLNGEPGELATWRELDALIQDQHWRAAHFRVAADDINYRRFFNINELAGLRMELPELNTPTASSSSCCARGCSMACASTTSTDCSMQRAIYFGSVNSHPAPSSKKSSLVTRRCLRTGQCRARPATNSPIWYWGC
jgi:(1->4)-alpha-D-glucan 1-alpha-D-glucosylmutase